MGGGVSKESHEAVLSKLASKDEEIDLLKKQLQCYKKQITGSGSRRISRVKVNEISNSTPTLHRPTMMNTASLPAKPNAVDFSIKQRRLEISAEVMNHGKTGSKYVRKCFPKSEETRLVIKSVIESNVLFKGLRKEEENDCVDAFYQVHERAGEVIIQQNDHGEKFFVIRNGTVEILVSSSGAPSIKFGELSKGMGFGELALLCNTPRAATIRAVTDVELWALERSTYREICTYYELLRVDKTLLFLKQVHVLSKLHLEELEKMAVAMEREEYAPNETIVREGEIGEHFYLLESGRVRVSKMNEDNKKEEDTIRYLNPGDHFGEMALFKQETRSATCTACADGPVFCLTLDRDHFSAMLGSLQNLMEREPAGSMKGRKRHKTLTETIGVNVESYVNRLISLNDLEILQTLGKGAFGRVKLVRHCTTNETYAIKCLNKHTIVTNNLMEHVINERNVMLALNHPFVLKLHTTLKDERYVYFLLEVALGGELFTYLRQMEKFTEQAAKFYTASVVLAFEHMHDKSIIYRDLKPENLILDQTGFLKVVDFGLAKEVHNRTWTLCGTPDYLAPEIILNKGHNKAVDYWALGILIYELISGNVPFYAEDPMQVYALVLNGNLKFPSHFGRPCIDLIQKLLIQNPARRLGNMKQGIKSIIQHKWFSGFDWEGLLNRNLEPPIVPNVKNNIDASNFEQFNDDEEEAPMCAWDPDF